MRKTLCIQLLALLALQLLHFTDGKPFDESKNEILSQNMREEDVAEEASLSKRETEDQDDEVEENEEVQERESEKNDYEEEIEEREPEDEAYEFDDEEQMEKRDDEDDDDSENTAAEEKREESHFKLVNKKGRKISRRKEQWGLLLYRGGTVCGNHFNHLSAQSICRKLKYADASNYHRGLMFGKMQQSKPIKLKDVICDGANWNLCSSTRTICTHHNDVFLLCKPRKE